MNHYSKITAFYYLAYPDSSPEDECNAGSETYIELGDESSRITDFGITISIFICTPLFLESLLKSQNSGAMFYRNLLVVSRFNDEVIRKAISSRLSDLQIYAERK